MSEFGKANETIMGLPRSGASRSSLENNNTDMINNNRGCKRPWNDTDTSSITEGAKDSQQPPTKLLCTSPPHGMCAEDVAHNQNCPSLVSRSLTATTTTSSENANTSSEEDSILRDEEEQDTTFEEDEEDRDLLDEEDKDSGFIDSNSADNSSDDDMDMRISNSAASSSNSSSTTSNIVVLPSCSSAFSSIPSVSSSYDNMSNTSPFSNLEGSTSSLAACGEVVSSSANILGTPCYSTATPLNNSSSLPPFSTLPDLNQPTELSVSVPSTNVNTTTTTSAYPGTVPTPSYDLNVYSPSFPPNSLPSGGLVSGSWSCNFYDANQPPTNKYMEIQTSKPAGGVASTGVVAVSVGTMHNGTTSAVPPSSQAIQCDANGKSYMELGSSSPYTQTYSADCSNYTTSPSNYNVYGNNYNQQAPNNQYYRPGYSPYSYPNGENYPSNYENNESTGCSYGAPVPYPPGSYPPKVHSVLPPRCMSPFCDSTKASRSPCYQQTRLSVLNMSMVKLNRFSRYPDPSLHKSVLICNTLRLIERELENEGTSMNALLSQQQMVPHCPPPPPPTPPPSVGEGPLPSMQPPMLVNCNPPSPIMPPPIAPPYGSGPLQYNTYNSPEGGYSSPGTGPSFNSPPENSLLPLNSLATNCDPLPSFNNNVTVTTPCVTSNNTNNNNCLSNNNCIISNNISSVSNSSIINSSVNSSLSTASTTSSSSSPSCEDRIDTSIDWCSVLSLPSQSELDTLNNSEYCDWTNTSSLESMEYTVTSTSTSSYQTVNTVSNSCTVPTSNSGAWKLPSLSAEDILKSFPDSIRRVGSNCSSDSSSSEEIDSAMDVAVES